MKARDLLSPLGWIYGAIADLRQNLYRRGAFGSYDLQVRTISVGNISTGGTGKTPLVAFIAEILAENGEKVGILTRGYGRENPKARVLVSDGKKIFADARQAGDEPFELANKLLGKTAVIADANRVEAGNWARETHGITTFILDDGFQHVRVKRDLDIVLIDATKPFGQDKLLPAGSLRENPRSLKRAEIVVISRANLVENSEISNLKSQISKINPDCRIFVSRNKISRVTKLKDFFAKSENLTEISEKVRMPESENFDLALTKSFPDHHFFAQSEIVKLEKEAIAGGAEILLTTAKDAAKLAHLNFNLPCRVIESGLVFDDESAFIEIIKSLKFKNSR